jgi:ATP-dependent 26S proteasome regulatory subunit
MQQNQISFEEKMRSYLKASYPLLWVKTHEEGRVIKDIINAFGDTKTPIIIYSWDAQNNLMKHKKDGGGWEEVKNQGNTTLMEIIKVCRKLGSANERSVILMKDFHAYIEHAGQIRFIRNAIEDLKARGNMIVFLSPVIKIPVELEKEIQIVDFSLPAEKHLGNVLQSVIDTVKKKYPEDTDKSGITPEVRTASIEAAKGMTHSEAHDAFSLAIVENQKFDNGFVLSVFDEKVKQVKKHGLLQYIKPDLSFESIGGLDGLKRWIISRSKAYTQKARDYGLPYPKGILLCGIPGCGKTLLAKATANEFGFPLFQLDVGSLFGKHVGETEENFRRVVETVDGIGRCILFIDEIEKALNRDAVSGKGDTGTSSRSFGTLLTWLSEHKSPVFVIGTSNDHTRLPAEFTRKGRFDELFWIDLPSQAERKDIFGVLLKRYNIDTSKLKLDQLAEEAIDFTGAEIENVIVSAMYARFAHDGKPVSTNNLVDEIVATTPFAQMCAADLENMRKNAEGKLRVATSSGAVRALEASKSAAGDRKVTVDDL